MEVQDRVAVELIACRRVLHLDLIQTHTQLFGQQHAGSGVDALAHLHVGHDQTHCAVHIDADKRIGRERWMAVGRCRSGIAGLQARTHDRARRTCGAHQEKRDRQAAAGLEYASAL